MNRLVIAALVAACSGRSNQVAVDCDKYIEHLDNLLADAIEKLPADQQEAAATRMLAKHPGLVATCHEHPEMDAKKYACEMAATTRDAWKACGAL